jgi:ketosteroid isomerase-like protein
MRFALRLMMLVPVGVLLSCAAYRMAVASTAETSNEAQIRALIETQAAAWNRGDLDAFMTAYWKSDETAFVGANGITRGWQAVLDRYRAKYPDRKAMGHLSFSDLEIHSVCADAAFVIGQFQLERENDKPTGIFTLDFKKFPDGWKIIVDHTTAFPAGH